MKNMLLALPVLAAALLGAAQDDPGQNQVREGQDLWDKGCANCHNLPDNSIRAHEIWIRMINTTA